MVAIVSGNGFGLSNTSAGVLGQQGVFGNPTLGNSKESAYVNIVNGTLTLQDSDDFLAARGINIAMTRTYNSLGTFNDGNGGGWKVGPSKQVTNLTGTLNTAGSTVTRIDSDGTSTVFTYNASYKAYRSTDGGGGHEYLTMNAFKEWVWTSDRLDQQGVFEAYDSTSNAGHITAERDEKGLRNTYKYNAAGQLSQIFDVSGDTVNYDYTNGNLARIRVVSDATGRASTTVNYTYDTSNRLTKVEIDLTPNDNDITDKATYTTDYTYRGTSNQITSVTQSDGTKLTFDYTQTPASTGPWLLTSVTDGQSQKTSYSYSTATGATTVTDPMGYKTIYRYDTRGQLIQVDQPSINGAVSVLTRYTYDAEGNVTRAYEARVIGSTTEILRDTAYAYNTSGDCILERDLLGNTIERSYSSPGNKLLAEVRYVTPDADGAGTGKASTPLSTRFVYDAQNRLRFVFTPEGRFTEYKYNAAGDLEAELQYNSALYNMTGWPDLGVSTGVTDLTISDTIKTGPIDKTKITRTDYTYDVRGLRASAIRYTNTDKDGIGINDAANPVSVTRYVYDQAGRLLTSYDGNNNTTTYTYDGLGRTLSRTDSAGNSMLSSYDDKNGTLTVTLKAPGAQTSATSVTIYARDKAGRLVSVQQRIADGVSGTVTNTYDQDGRLRVSTGAAGQKTYWLYDEAGRTIAQIEDNGALTEYVYNNRSQLTRTIRYTAPVSTDGLLDALGQPKNVALNSLRANQSLPASSTYSSYDSAGRLIAAIDANGYLTRMIYDGASRLISTIHRAVPVDITKLDGVYIADSYTGEASDDDRISRFFYDKDGLLAGELDTLGHLTEYKYNAAGLLVDTVAYKTAVDPANRGAATLALLGQKADAGDIHQRNFYNGKNQLVGVVDGDNYLTELTYDAAGNVASRIRYATAVTAPAAASFADVGKTKSPNDRATAYHYNALNQLDTELEPGGTKIEYRYDINGKAVSVTRGVGAADQRSSNLRYDGAGRLIAELNAEGAARLAALPTPLKEADVAAIWAKYASRYNYNANGLRTSMTDVAGNRTLYYYDSLGRPTHTVNALGEVQQQNYDTFGQVIKTIAYGKRIAATTLASLTGGQGDSVFAALTLTGGVDATTELYYDKGGRVRYVVEGGGQVQERAYNAFNQVQQVISYTSKVSGAALPTLTGGDTDTAATQFKDLRGNLDQRTMFYYDTEGRLRYTVNPLGEIQGQSYDAFGRVETAIQYGARVASPSGLKGASTETAAFAAITAGNSTVSYAYNQSGSVTVMTVNGNRTLNTYNAFGQTVKVVREAAVNQVTQTVYDANGRVKALIDATGAVTAYEYDSDGRVADQIRYANVLTGYADAADIGAVLDAALAAKTLSDPSRDQHQRFIYDGNGDLEATLTAQTIVGVKNAQDTVVYTAKWAVQRQIRDGDGRVTSTIAYSFNMATDTLVPTAAAVRSWFVGADTRISNDPTIVGGWPVDIGPVNDAVVRYVYDGAGRVTNIATAQSRVNNVIQWSLARQEYDARGNVTVRTALATPLGNNTPSDADIVGVNSIAAGADAITRYSYDGANRVVMTATAQGPTAANASPPSTQQWALTKTEYDNFGNVSRRLQYATLLQTNTPPADLSTSPSADAKVDRSTYYRYDALNRLAATIDAAGAVTVIRYDVYGNAVQSVAYATTTKLPADFDINQALQPEDRVTRTVYDLQHRPVYEIDALGQLTGHTYDALGNMTSTVRYATALTADQLSTLAALGTAITVADVKPAAAAGLDRVERYAYDQDGRLRYTIDAAGYLKETVYTVLGQVKETRDYLRLPDPLLSTAPTMRELDAAAVLLLAADAASVNSYRYNSIGKLIESTDPQKATEYFRYDGLGNKIGYTNKVGSVWSYIYDSAGHMVAEVSPQVTAYASKFGIGMGGWGTGTQGALVTAFEYDALGNLTKRREAVGTASERATSYRYDARGRQTQTILPPANIYNDGGDPKISEGAAGRYETLDVARVITVGYNTFGEAVSNRDVDGKSSYKVYDLRGQVAYDVDALGYVTGYERTAFGEVKLLTRFNAAPNALAAGKTPAMVGAADFASSINRGASADRSITTRYDLLGRVIKVSEPITDLFDQHAVASANISAGKTTDTTYNIFGELSRQAVYGADGAGKRVTEGGDTRYYYDARGNRRTRIDVLTSEAGEHKGTGYVTSYAYGYDAAAKASTVTTTEYATFDDWDDTKAGGGLSPTVAASDRVTRAVYDQSNRLIRDVRVGVTYISNGAQTTGDVAASYGYDKLGRQTSVTDALGGTIYTYYDALGRTIAVAKAQASGYADVSPAGAPLTEFKLDILGNAVYRIDYADGAPGPISADGYGVLSAGALTNAANRVTATRYDGSGHAVEVLDAEQFANGAYSKTIQTSYDIYGRVAKQWRSVSGRSATGADRQQTAFEITRYDALGRVKETETPGNENAITNAAAQRVRKTNAYNAFGELVNTYLTTGGNTQELTSTKYDQAGHAWYSNAGDGIDTINLFDAQGNVTAQIRGTGTGTNVHQLAGFTSAAQASTLVDRLRTETRYDRLGHVVDSRQVDDTRLIVLKRIDGVWTRVRLEAGQSTADSLVLVGDRSEAPNTISIKYRKVGATDWIEAAEPRLQWIGDDLVFSTTGLATGSYEYALMVKPKDEPAFERSRVTLEVSAGVDATRAAHIVQLFRVLFNRAPDVESVNFWIAAYNEGRSETQIIQAMLLSPEAAGLALTAGGGNAYGIIEAIYRDAFKLTDLSTAARQAEMRAWAARYANVAAGDNRAQTLGDLLNNAMAFGGPAATQMTEWSNGVVADFTNYGYRLQIVRIYITLFGRAPETSGIEFWLNAMRQGLSPAGVAEFLLSSAEGQQPWLYPTAGLTTAQINQQLINHVYSAMLGRSPTAGENSGWLAKLGPNLTASQFVVMLATTIGDGIPTDAQSTADKALFNNKVSLAYAAGVSAGGEFDAEAGSALLAGVTSAGTAKDAADRAILALRAAADAAKVATPVTVIAAGAMPLEDTQRVLARLYVTLLNRGPDNFGLDFYIKSNEVKTGQWSKVAQGFLDSDELKAVLGDLSKLSDKDFVAKLYATALGAVPTSPAALAEMAMFTQQLTLKSRAQVAFNIATGILEQPGLSDNDKTSKMLFNNKVAVGMTAAISLGNDNQGISRAMLAMVTANSITAALDYGYANAKAQFTDSQLAAATAAAIADNISKAALAGVAATTAATALATRPTSVARLQLVQMYVGLLGRNAATFGAVTDVTPLNEYVALIVGGMSMATVAQFFIDSPEGKAIFDPALSNQAFVTKVYQQILGASGMVPQQELNAWVQQLNTQPAPTRGKIALDILNAIQTYASAAPDANAVAYLNAKAALNAKVVSAFAAVDSATIAEQTPATTLRNTLKSAADSLASALSTLKTNMTNALTTKQNALNLVTTNMTAANAAGDGKGQLRLQLTRLYASVLKRATAPSMVNEIDFYLKSPEYQGLTQAQILERTAQFLVTGSEGRSIYTADSYNGTDAGNRAFVVQLYSTILGRIPDGTENLTFYVDFMRANAGPYVLGRTVMLLLEAQAQYSDGTLAQLNYKKAFDQKVAGFLTKLSGDASADVAAANSVKNQEAALQAAINAAQAEKTRLDAAAVAPALLQGVADANIIFNLPNRRAVVELYSALRGAYDLHGVAFQMDALWRGATTLDNYTNSILATLVAVDYPADNTAFILRLYAKVLGRTNPPAAEVQWHIDNELNAGQSRAQVAKAFILAARRDIPAEFDARTTLLENGVIADANQALASKQNAEFAAQDAAARLQNARAAYANFGITAAEAAAKVTAAQAVVNSFTSVITANNSVIAADTTVYNATDATLKYNAKLVESTAATAAYQTQVAKVAALALAVADGATVKASAKAISDAAGFRATAATALAGNVVAGRAQQITHLYFGLLNHTPKLVELQFALDRMERGATLAEVANDIINSAEAKTKNLYPATMTNAAFVTQLYSYALGRGFSADPTGLAFWTNQMVGGVGRAEIAALFVTGINQGSNNDTSVLNNKATTALKALSIATVTTADVDAYIVLNNDAARAAATLAGAAAAAALAASPDAGYVIQIARLYLAIFNRIPDAAGVRFWLNYLRANPNGAAAMAQSMIADADEGKLLYPPGGTLDSVIGQIFSQGMGRLMTAAELAKYKAQSPAQSKGQIALNIINDILATGTSNNVQVLGTRAVFVNKVENALGVITADAVKYEKGLQAAIQAADAALAKGVTTRVTRPTLIAAIGSQASGARVGSGTARFEVDRWGNVLTVSDLRDPNYKITYQYNYSNQLIDQTLNALVAAGAPHSSTGYDALGRQVRTTDFMGNINKQGYDANGNVVTETHADDGQVKYTYNLFGDRTAVIVVRAYGQSDVWTNFAYDHLGHMIRSWSEASVVSYTTTGWGTRNQSSVAQAAAQLNQYFNFDELGRQVSSMDAIGAITRSDYDLDGNVIRFNDVRGSITQYVYDAFHHKTAMVDALGARLNWAVDSWGVIGKEDNDGSATTRTYTKANIQVTESNNIIAYSTTYRYDAAGRKIAQQSNIGQDIEYSYTGGLLTKINDKATGLTTTYSYDLAGNRLTEKQAYATAQAGVRQNNTLAYDMQNRVSDIRDDVYALHYDYDANGNRTHVRTEFDEAPTVRRSYDSYNAYDSMNRQTIVNGDSADGGKTVVFGAHGHAITYDWAGNRLSDTSIGVNIALVNGKYVARDGLKTVEEYVYDALGRLTDVRRDGIVINTRLYDAGGRVAESGLKTRSVADGLAAAVDAAGGSSETHIYAYDSGGNIISQQDNSYSKDNAVGNNIRNLWFGEGYDKVGNLRDYTVSPLRGDNVVYTITYAFTNGYRELTNSHNKSNALNTSYYDVNGNRTLVRDASTGKVVSQLWFDADGHVQSRIDTVDGKPVQHFWMIANGQVLGEEDKQETNVLGSTYAGVTSASLSAPPSSYSVQGSGETLQTIAQAVWGDSKLWYLIADANGLTTDDSLKAGQLLRIPARVNTVHNDYATFRPYDAADALGNTAPAMPPPNHGGGCGAIGTLIMVVVAVAVTLYTAGAMSGFTGSFLGTMQAGAGALVGGTSLTTGAVAAAAGSIASQGVGIAIGAQDEFSWKGVAFSAVGGAVTAGLPANVGGFSNVYASAIARGVASNALVQGVGITTGLQNGFDWRGVAASAAGAVAGTAFSDSNIFGTSQLAQRTVSGFAAGAAASIMRSGKIEVARIATDAFGNALGESLASMTSGGSSEQVANKPNLSVLQSIAELNDDSVKPQMNFSDEGYQQARPLAERLGLTSSSATPQMSVATASGYVGGYTTYSSFSLQMSDGGTMPGEEATYHRPLPEIDAQQRYAGGVTQSAAMGWREAMNPGNSWGQRAIFGGLALAATPDAMIESVLYAPLNAAPAMRESAQYFARANMQTDPSARNLDYLHTIQTGAEAFDSATAWLLGGKPQAGTIQSAESYAAARSTYAFDRSSVEKQLIDSLGSNIKSNPLRLEYEQKVAELSSFADKIQPKMSQDQLLNLATEANQARRNLGVQYKNLTPEPLRDFIYEINQSRYGDPLGPNVNYLVEQGRTYTDIIKSASRPNPNVDVLLGKFGEWLQGKPDAYIQKHVNLIQH